MSLCRGDREGKNSSVHVHFATCLQLSNPGNDVIWESGDQFSICSSNKPFHTFIPSELHCLHFHAVRLRTISSIGLLCEKAQQEIVHEQVNEIFLFFCTPLCVSIL